jgi:potassium-transporting ATPase KdpC subunit
MLQNLTKSLSLLTFLIVITCGVYPLALWTIGQTLFPFQANGSLLNDSAGNTIGSKLIAQPFTKDEYFQPRPSAASYDASASASSALAASNYALRDRIARALSSIVKLQNGELAAPEVEKWFQENKSNTVTDWTTLHPALAQAWVSADPAHAAYVDDWMKAHPDVETQFKKDNPTVTSPKAADMAVVFFQSFSKENPAKFPELIAQPPGPDGKVISTMQTSNSGADIQADFFDMWRQDNPDVVLQNIPGDMVTTSASGLDPHITLQNAEFQLNRVAAKWAVDLKRNPDDMKKEIEQVLHQNVSAPLGGLAGEKIINVLEVNLELHKRYGSPP